jgi:hypothetical protein
MTRRTAASATDTIQVSHADLERIAAEEQLHAEHRTRTALVIASAARDAEDCRLLLDILGLDTSEIAAALEIAHRPKVAATPARKSAVKTKPVIRRKTAA